MEKELEIHTIRKHMNDYPRLERLNEEAFPPAERIPFHKLADLAARGQIHLKALYEDGNLLGFYAVLVYGRTTYLLFLAIEASLRGQGYGTRALAYLKQEYRVCQLVLDIELEDEEAPNQAQRRRRKEFYQTNGYRESGLCLSCYGMDFEVLYQGKGFDEKEFRAMLERMREMGFTPQIWKKGEKPARQD